MSAMRIFGVVRVSEVCSRQDTRAARRCPSGRGCGRTGMPSWEGEFRAGPGKRAPGARWKVRVRINPSGAGRSGDDLFHARSLAWLRCHRLPFVLPAFRPRAGRGGSVIHPAGAGNPDPIGPVGADTSIVSARLVFVIRIPCPGPVRREPIAGLPAAPLIGRVRAFQRMIVFARRCARRENAGMVALGLSHLSSPDERTSYAGDGTPVRCLVRRLRHARHLHLLVA